eukprot:jgi/Psemu1/202126/e_gw1.291.35.1
MKSYTPIEIPEISLRDPVPKVKKNNVKNGKNLALVEDEGGSRTLGKWFPNAILIKTIKLIVKDPRSSLVLFYQYTTNDGSADVTSKERNKKWDRQRLQLLITYLSTIARRRNLGGRIRVATEGVNATISAVDTSKCTAKAALRHLAEDLRRFDPRVFSNTDFKYLDDLPADRQFKEFKILPVQELVFYDIGEDDAPLDNENSNENSKNPQNDTKNDSGASGGGIHLDASSFHTMLQKDNTVVIDVRNNYETILGRFDGQQHQKSDGKDKPLTEKNRGAEYIDPKMRKSTDFKSWLAKPETQEKLEKKTVLMYCTGGIRCERASAYLRTEMKDKVEQVYQLKGGIERYLKQFKDGGFWRGKNFVFDKREAVSVDNPHGDGGIVRREDRKEQKKKTQSQQQKNDTEGSLYVAKCCVCGNHWDRYVGKKKCLTCGVPVLMCEKCMSLKPDKTPGMELKVRCPLCVEEGVTVLANELELTANGIKNKKAIIMSCESVKAAGSVLKWGGGHAIKKKKMKKMKRRACQFGSNCVRKDCFFFSPRTRSKGEQNKCEGKMKSLATCFTTVVPVHN